MIDPDPKTQEDTYIKRVGSLCRDDRVLSASVLSDINQVFYGEGTEGRLSATDLSIRYVTGQEYHDLVTGPSDQFEPKTLYIVSSDEINAYNTNIKNVADPEEEKDAANKWYVDSVSSRIHGNVESLNNELETLVGTTSAETLVSAYAYADDKISELSYSNVYISSISSDELGNVSLDVAEKLDKFTIYKFDSLSAYNLSGSTFGILPSDIVLIDEENINAEGHRILSVASPVDSDDAATKGYVDTRVTGVKADLKDKIAKSEAISALISQVNPSDGISGVKIQMAISALLDLVNILSGNA